MNGVASKNQYRHYNCKGKPLGAPLTLSLFFATVLPVTLLGFDALLRDTLIVGDLGVVAMNFSKPNGQFLLLN